jgi:hypothetical protein
MVDLAATEEVIQTNVGSRGVEIKLEGILELSKTIIITITMMMSILQIRLCIRYIMLQGPLHHPVHPRHIHSIAHRPEEHHRIVK